MAEEELEVEGEGKPWYLGRAFLIGGSSVLLLGVAGVVAFLLSSSAPKKQVSLAPAEIEDPDGVLTGALLRLEPLTVNIESTTTFLQLSVVFEYFELYLPLESELHVPRLRDAMLRVLRTKKAEELLSDEGKENLRLELIGAANRALGAEDEIVDVYFEQYVLQSS